MTRPPPRGSAPLNALLIDLDGTCCDTHGLIRTCFDHAIRTHFGRPGPVELWARHAGLPLDEVLKATFEHYGVQPTPAEIAQTVDTYRSHMRAHADEVRAFPGVREALTVLRSRGIKLAIVTTKYRAMALRHLQTSSLEHLFDILVTGDECNKCKPDPEPFLRALRALDVPPESAAGVGDSRHDIVAAHAAGLYTVAACWGTDTRDALIAAGPDDIAETPADLVTFFGCTP